MCDSSSHSLYVSTLAGMSQPFSLCCAPVPPQWHSAKLSESPHPQPAVVQESGLTAPSMHRPAQESSTGSPPARNVIQWCDITKERGVTDYSYLLLLYSRVDRF